MAGDWIKMRIDLQSHPKIVRILSATASDKFRVIGGLHAVWSVFDTHSENGVLKGYTPDLMDHIIGWPGFSRAMEAVGWLVFDGHETLSMPEFDEHNGKSAKRRAEDQKRKRDSRKESDQCPDGSGQKADKKRTREREDISKPNGLDKRPGAAVFPPDVPDQVKTDFLALRKIKKAPLTQTALDGIAREAKKADMSLTAVLEMCCTRGWQGFKAEWVKDLPKGGEGEKPPAEHKCVKCGGYANMSTRNGWACLDHVYEVRDGVAA